jgi:alpha-L-rhamnosidase
MHSASIRSTIFTAALGFLVFAGTSPVQADLSPEQLSCEYKSDPLAVDSVHPRLFWKVTSKDRGEQQTAYQIIAASTPERLSSGAPDLWDTGKVTSSETIQLPYGGKPLSSGQQVFWKVRVWDKNGKPSGWSKTATWAAGLLAPSDWKAKWIGPKVSEMDGPAAGLKGAKWIWFAGDGTTPPAGIRHFRSTVNIPADIAITSAKLSVTADDRYTVSVNSSVHKGPTGTDSWRSYQTYDVAKELRAGPNILTIQAENTETGGAGVIARLLVTTANGQQIILATDNSWEAADSANGSYTPVRVVGNYGVGPWNEIASGSANEMTPPPYFRKTFTPSKPIKHAVLYATALGAYHLSLNGKAVDKDILSPGWTEFRKRVHYLAYDVTKQLKPGANALGAILGDGWYASYIAFTGKRHFYGGDPKLRLQLVLEYADGTQEIVGTDESWQTAYGAITSADLLMGTEIDTRKEMPGWDTATFTGTDWKPATVQPNPDILIEAQPNEPIRPTQEVKARKLTTPKPGVFIYDIGQNLVGWVRLKVTGKAGQKITVRHAERLNPDGTVYLTNLRAAKATDTYILKGGTQILEPMFTFHGFQYVEVTGADTAPDPASVTAVVFHSDLKSTIKFSSDNPLLNKLVDNIDWGFRGNALDVPTDCPQRNERAGWTADAQVFTKTAMFHRDSAPFFSKWLQDVEDGQFPDGSYPDVAPSVIGGGNAAWEDAGVIVPYRMWEMYGDTRILEDHWASMTRFMEYLQKKAPDGIRPTGSYGDWLLLQGPRLSSALGTGYYFYSATLMTKMAQALGKTDEATKYQALADKIKAVFNERYVTPEGLVQDAGKDSQTFYAMALEWNLIDSPKRPQAAKRLESLLAQSNNHLSTGFIGTPLLLQSLAGVGQAKLANELLLNDTYPSWLYQVKLGATTMWERWDGWTPEKGFQDPGMNSFNHYWLGCVGEWMYSGVAGIDTNGPGWSKISIRPQIDGKLQKASVSYDSIRGRVESGWQKSADGGLTLAVTIPANTTAMVSIPAKAGATVTESGKPVAQVQDVTFVRQESDRAVYSVGSGKYTFKVNP